MTTNVPQDVESLILGADDLISRREAITSIDEYAKRWNGEIVDPVTIRRILKELRAQRQQGAEPVPIYQYTENELGGGFVQWNDCKESTMKAMAEKGISTRIVYTTPPQANAIVAAFGRKAAEIVEAAVDGAYRHNEAFGMYVEDLARDIKNAIPADAEAVLRRLLKRAATEALCKVPDISFESTDVDEIVNSLLGEGK
jgi:hypothetical protein